MRPDTSQSMTHVPEFGADMDTLACALALAKAGGYVVPLTRGTKNPGSVLGRDWPRKSSRDQQVITSWFAGTDHGLALHAGRSDLVILDRDQIEHWPDWLDREVQAAQPPTQTTRSNDDGAHAHFLFRQPIGRMLGNGTGQLGGPWGDVRGANGVIVVYPSPHPSPEGEYHWTRTGPIPVLPDAIAAKLTDAAPSECAATDAAITEFVTAYSTGTNTNLIDAWGATYRRDVARGESRHTKALSMLAGGLKEAAAGLFPAGDLITVMRAEFLAAVARNPIRQQGARRTGAVAESEWHGILAWCVAQARVADPVATLARLAEHAPGMGDNIWAGRTVSQAKKSVVSDIPAASEASGSAASAGSSGSSERCGEPGRVLDGVRAWFARFICTNDDDDLDVLTLWAVHTHVAFETYTSPRLLLDSPVPGSGKTTTLDHLSRLCMNPVQMASLSSPALLTRMLHAGPRTILIDEADRSLSPDKEGVGELLAVLNSGYKRGATRPVLVPVKGGGWDATEMPTFAPVAMAGNNPNLPDDTRSRSIRVLLMPDIDGSVEDSDWELHEADADALGRQVADWADLKRDGIKANRPSLPDAVRGRARERWAPLKRVAVAEGGRWPAVVDRLADLDMQRIEAERAEGIVQQRPAVVLLTHLNEVWKDGETFIKTETVIDRLVGHCPDMWGPASSFGKRLTSQRLGRMLATSYNIHSARPDTNGSRGYLLASLSPAFRRFGLLPNKPDEPAEVAEPAGTALEPLHGESGAAPGNPYACPTCGIATRPSITGHRSYCLACSQANASTVVSAAS